jgi:hypothetical protein
VNATSQSIPFSTSRDQFSQILMTHNHFHLFRTHDEDDAALSKDTVMGYQGPHLHIALSFCIHWGGSLVISLPDGITHVRGCGCHLIWVSFVLLPSKYYSLNQAQLINLS